MYQKNLFQNGIIFLIVMMLLVIPNMQIYSSIGNYQTYSMAITANNYLKHSYSGKKKIPKSLTCVFVNLSLFGIFVSLAIAFSVAYSSRYPQSVNRDIYGGRFLEFVNFYEKHDFSKFDN